MWKYLKAAYWTPLPAFGRFPIQPLATLAFGIAGFVNPWIWVVGFGLQAALTVGLASNERFQRLARARQLALASARNQEEKRKELRASLGYKSRGRLRALEKRSRRVLEVQLKARSEFDAERGHEGALRRLEWAYLKLLLAHDLLASPHVQADETKLQAQVADLEAAISRPGASESATDSREATLRILRKRLETLERREQTLEEIEADLGRVEAQVELALESSTLQGGPPIVSQNIDLAADLLESAVYGEYAAAIRDVDLSFVEPDAAPHVETRVTEG